MNPGDESMNSFDEYIVPTGSNIVDCGKVIENLAYMEDTLGKSAEKPKHAIDNQINIMMNSEGVMEDESILLLDERDAPILLKQKLL